MFGRRSGALAAAVAMAAAVMGLMTAAGASASSRARAHQPLVVRPRFRYVGQAGWIWAGARYALADVRTATGPTVIVTDDQTGQSKTIARAGCLTVEPSALEPLDLPWIVFECNPVNVFTPFTFEPAPELYSPATGQWLAVSPSPGVSPVCSENICTVSYFPVAAGRYWLAYQKDTCDSGGQHCSPSDVFQNLQTGELRQDPSGGSTAVDLNAHNLTQTVCAPLKVPTSFAPYAPGPVPGPLTFYGSFALAFGGDATGGEAYLERCGSRLHQLVGTGPAPGAMLLPAANTSEVVWMAQPRPSLSALTLPGLRPFTIALPQRLIDARACAAASVATGDLRNCVAQIALTNRRLYVVTVSNPEQLWAASNPLPPKRQHK